MLVKELLILLCFHLGAAWALLDSSGAYGRMSCATLLTTVPGTEIELAKAQYTSECVRLDRLDGQVYPRISFGWRESFHISLGPQCRVFASQIRDAAGRVHLIERRYGRGCENQSNLSMRKDKRFVICSYNTWNWNGDDFSRRMAEIRSLLAEQECDVALLQEMRSRWTARGSEFMMTNLSESFSSFYFAPAMSYREDRKIDEEGLAIMSRSFPIGVPVRTLLSNAAKFDKDDFHHRMLLRVSIQTPLGPIHFFNTHSSLSAVARERNAREIVKVMRATKGHKILAGDLNGEEDDEMYRILLEEGNMIDTAKGRSELTFPTWHPKKRIDFIFTQGPFQVVSSRTFGGAHSQRTAPSDHLGLRVELSSLGEEDVDHEEL